MGYNTDFSGKFNLNKEITFSLSKTFEKLNNGDPTGIEGQIEDGYCQWVPTDDGKAIHWDSGEKFYDYVEWLKWIIDKLLKPEGFILNGEVEWDGEESGDVGKIIVKDNVIVVQNGKITYNREMKLTEIGDNLITYILENKPKEVCIDITGHGLSFYDHVAEAIKGRSNTKLIRMHGIGKTDGMAFRVMK